MDRFRKPTITSASDEHIYLLLLTFYLLLLIFTPNSSFFIMRLPIYQIDAFASQVFKGNPAAVVITQDWLTDEHMQKIAQENNLSETAFVVPEVDGYGLRWFTPEIEVDLCGHATLAAAYVLFRFYEQDKMELKFQSKNSGILGVKRIGENLELDFPADPATQVELSELLAASVNIVPKECWQGKTDYMLVYDTQEEIEQIDPDFVQMNLVLARGIIVTAPGKEVDFVSRFFAPQSGVPEDPVTGSAHTTLMPYWAKRLNKKELTARQLSKRTGDLKCTLNGSRVAISGQAVLYMTGEIIT
jgi:PhzF family phenazine biosynthesis protein